jgi:glutamyl-tRNA reductase
VLAVVAINHQRASLAILEQVNLDVEGCAVLAKSLLQFEGVSEAAVLSTCNRTELYLSGSAPDTDAALRALADQTHADLDVVVDHAWHATGQQVAQHLFRVAAGLESRVAGEREILGQVRTAISVGRAAGTVGSHLDCLFRSAIAVGRRVQQTDRSSPALLPEIGLDAARPDADKPVGLTMVMGAGLMAAETVQELIARRMEFVVCARRVERAALLARRADQVVPFDQLPEMLVRAEVVVCATGARAPLLNVADVELAMARRNGRPLVIVDLSLPRNVDPAAGRVPGVRLLDLEDLVSGSSLAELRRRTETVEEEFRRFSSWLAGQLAGHLIARLHSGVRELCREALVDAFADAGLESAAIVAASHTLAGRILHAPTLTIKSLVAEGDGAAALAVLTSFGISADGSEPRSIPNARSIRLVARSGRHFGEIGRVRGRIASAVSIAS